MTDLVPNQELSFEDALAQLEELVASLEAGRLPMCNSSSSASNRAGENTSTIAGTPSATGSVIRGVESRDKWATASRCGQMARRNKSNSLLIW